MNKKEIIIEKDGILYKILPDGTELYYGNTLKETGEAMTKKQQNKIDKIIKNALNEHSIKATIENMEIVKKALYINQNIKKTKEQINDKIDYLEELEIYDLDGATERESDLYECAGNDYDEWDFDDYFEEMLDNYYIKIIINNIEYFIADKFLWSN